jgi:hypothetical protein
MTHPRLFFVLAAVLIGAFTSCSDSENTSRDGASTGRIDSGNGASGGSTGNISGGTNTSGGSSITGGNPGVGGANRGGAGGQNGGSISGGSAGGGAAGSTGGTLLSGGTSGQGGATGTIGGGGGSTATGGAIITGDVERWGVYEISLNGPSSGNPYVDVKYGATFTQGTQSITVPGFWDGGSTYKIRFSPPTTGDWSYQTTSSVAELNGKTGSFKVGDATGTNHGPVEIVDTFYFRYADGSRYHQYGTTSYAWVHQSESLQEQTVKTLATSPFNKMRMTVFPKDYVYNKNEPPYFAFQKKSGGFDYSRPDPAFWRNFEKRILDLQKLGIQADLILWHPYDRWGFPNMGDEADDRYLRYCIARLSAFRNVWWSLANEFNLIKSKQMDDWDRFFSILDKEDPHHRMRGIHNLSVVYDHTKPWVTHASLQKWDPLNGLKYRSQYGKPVIFDESGYEGNIPQGFGNKSGLQETQLFWQATFTGTYQGHGECFKDSNDVLWWSKGGVLKGESPARIKFLSDEIMAKAPPFNELKPDNLVLAKEGEYYLAFCPSTGAKTIDLKGPISYKVESIDLWEMKFTSVGTAPPGPYTFTPSKANVVYRFSPAP